MVEQVWLSKMKGIYILVHQPTRSMDKESGGGLEACKYCSVDCFIMMIIILIHHSINSCCCCSWLSPIMVSYNHC